MRIKKIEIASFGKFKNFSMDFSEGFNLIFGKNEDGKSTVMAFIALMLYGTAGTASRSDISQNIRKKYLPWSGEQMAGDMEIESGGKNYLIHKEFRGSAKTDKVSITDTETGEKISLPPDTEVGKYFLGIDYAGFEKSIFGGTAESFAGTENGDISTKLSNLSESGDEGISSKIVLSRLEGAKDDLIKKRSKGRLTLAQEKARELSAQIEEIKATQEKQKLLRDEYIQTEKELTILQGKAEKSRLALEIEEKRIKANRFRTLARLYNQASLQEDELSAFLKDDNAEDVLEKGHTLKNTALFAKERLDELGKIPEESIISEEDMKEYFILREEKQKAETKNAENDGKFAEKHLKLSAGLIPAGIILFVAGIAGGFFHPPLFVFGFLGAISAIGGTLIRRKAKHKEAAAYSAKKQLDEINNKLQNLYSQRNCNTSEEFERAYREGIAANERKKLWQSAKDAFDKATSEFMQFISRYVETTSFDNGLNILIHIENMHSELKKALQNAEAYAVSYGIEISESEKLLNLAQDIEKELPEETAQELNGEKIEKEIRQKNSRLLEINGQLGAEPGDLGALERELYETNEKIAEMSEYYESLTLAAQVLSDAEDEMRRSFAPQLKNRASEILAELTQGKYKNLSTDKAYDIEIKSEETAGYRNWHYLSRGTVAQSYLALRIAICEMLSDKESIPLMLDDILADYDDDRSTLAIEFLEKYTKSGHQVLFFTCHSQYNRGKSVQTLS